MSRVVVNTQNYMFADMLKKTLDTSDFNVTLVEKTENLIAEFNRTAANIVLLEINDCNGYRIGERLQLRNQMKKIDPDCKIVFLVDEKREEKIAEKVLQAKIDGLIDQFVFGSISATYLIGILKTL